MRSKRFGRFALAAVLFSTPAILSIAWTVWPAASAVTAILKADYGLMDGAADVAAIADGDVGAILSARRSLQKHFLKHDVYISLDDIVVPDPLNPKAGDMPLLMQKACGKGKLFVWTPLRVRLPLIGERVFEWCWKPRFYS